MIRRAEKARLWLAEVPALRKKNRKHVLWFAPNGRDGQKLGGFVVRGQTVDAKTAYEAVLRVSKETPVALREVDARRYWIYKDRFWWENEKLEAQQVQALVDDRDRKRTRQIARAQAAATMDSLPDRGVVREVIPDDVKMFVWQRDKGRCVRCDSQSNLEFDHVIPLVMGGANTARNLQLLCEQCNRSKGGNLA